MALKVHLTRQEGQIEVFDQFKELDEHFTAEKMIAGWEAVTKEDVKKMAAEIYIGNCLSVIGQGGCLRWKKFISIIYRKHYIRKNWLMACMSIFYRNVDFQKHLSRLRRNMVQLIVHLSRVEKREEVTVPDGIAHFLEHKMFEKEDGDVFQKFSVLGASANAFTSFTRTAYLFSATDKLYDNTEILLDFVQEPYFTEKTVDKEKGIIAQEITMYDDLPDWRLYFGTIENLYHEHPVKIDIAGTVESIQDITAEHLYECYETFYHPSNMVLFVVGAVDPDEMMAFHQEKSGCKNL